MPDNLPAVPADSEVDSIVYDGEVVGDSAPLPAVRAVTLSPHAVRVIRHGGYVLAGVVVIARKWHHRRMRYHRAMDAAEATGDHETMHKWATLHEQARHQKHQRLTGRVEAFVAIVKVFPWVLAAWLIAMGLTGVFLSIARKNWGDLAWPWLATAHAVNFGVELAIAVGIASIFVAPLVVLALLYYHGRNAGSFAPGWLATSSDADIDTSVDERAISQALDSLALRPISIYLKDGLLLQFIVPCRIEGRGTYCEVRLPKGATVEEIVKRRTKLAGGLYRLPNEAWPSMGGDASHLKLWIADKGALAEGAGPYPLLREGFTDVFKGLPFGRTLRGDAARMPAIGRNTICGGAPEQGKSNTARVVACGYTLDIITELRIYIPDTNFDFEGFKRRCSRYVMGAEDEYIEQMLEDQELLKEELQRRGQLLVDYEVQEVTREIAHAGVGLHPVLILLEEAHVAIQHGKHGKDFSQLLGENVKLDRKRGMHIMVSTQAPVRGSMPRDVTTNCTNGIAHAVSDIYANDALLGPGAHSGGHRATELIIDTDKGTALCKGFSGEARSEVVQVHKVDANEVPPIVNRALAEMARRGHGVPGSAHVRAIEARDLLTDLDAVLGSERVRLSDLPALLRDHAKTYGPYKALTGTRLKELLDDEGVRTTNVGNVPRLDPEDLRRRLAEGE